MMMKSENNKCKTAYYKFSRKKLLRNYSIFNEIFSSRIERFQTAYSFKTNSYYPLIEELNKAGCYAEVVSPEEYALALKAGYSKNRIVFNGVCKTAECIIDCSTNEGLVNIDNKEDLDVALLYYERTKVPLKVGIRITFDIENGIKSHFGINIESNLFKEIQLLNREGRINVKGLHCHFTNATTERYWRKKVDVLCETGKLFNTEYLDFGGNLFPISRPVMDNENQQKLKLFADILAEKLENCYEKSERPLVILEPGTPLASDSFNLVAHVTGIKDDFVFLDCSIFDLGLNATGDYLKIIVEHTNDSLHQTDKKITAKTLVGYTCLENDIIKKSYCSPIFKGDLVIFKSCGAYSLNWSNNFIKPVLPVVDAD